jgi:hypothetical protein
LRDPQVWLDVVQRVAHGTQSFAASTEHVGGSDGVEMKQLAQNHGYT